MADSQTDSVKSPSWAQRLKRLLVPSMILLMAAAILFLIAGNWNTWASERASQETDDAYLRADLTPLSTKVAGLVATVGVSDYQPVKAGDLLVQLRDDDFRAQVQQAEAGGSRGQRRAHQQSAAERIAGRPHRHRLSEGIRRGGSGYRGGGGRDRGGAIGDRECSQRNRCEPSGRGTHDFGTAPSGSADCG